jgi:hypothetical protein
MRRESHSIATQGSELTKRTAGVNRVYQALLTNFSVEILLRGFTVRKSKCVQRKFPDVCGYPA